ncbi:hypothetical protein C8R45DRAFT_1110071 [Mycena sanguinolenta]|nr:hypothetical protein C8R45DRAFT_1110071 [Mycena sanguinolenta]
MCDWILCDGGASSPKFSGRKNTLSSHNRTRKMDDSDEGGGASGVHTGTVLNAACAGQCAGQCACAGDDLHATACSRFPLPLLLKFIPLLPASSEALGMLQATRAAPASVSKIGHWLWQGSPMMRGSHGDGSGERNRRSEHGTGVGIWVWLSYRGRGLLRNVFISFVAMREEEISACVVFELFPSHHLASGGPREFARRIYHLVGVSLHLRIVPSAYHLVCVMPHI